MLRRLLAFAVVVLFCRRCRRVRLTRVQLPVVLDVPAQGAVLEGVTVINPGHPPEPGRRVVIEGGRIARIEAGPASASGAYAGSYVLPGLTDMHVHLPINMSLRQVELFGFLFLAYGVTTVRDAGSIDGSSLEYRERMRRAEFPGPRIYACGPFVDGDPPRWPARSGAHAGRGPAVVDELAALVSTPSTDGRTQYPGSDPRGRREGLPVIGHVPTRVPYETALLDDAQHLIGAAECLRRAESRAELRRRGERSTRAVRADRTYGDQERSREPPTLVSRSWRP
jgi:hypothetical protein